MEETMSNQVASFRMPMEQSFRAQVVANHALLGFKNARCKDAISFQRAMKDLVAKYVEIETVHKDAIEKLDIFLQDCTGESNVIEIWSEAVLLGQRWPNAVAKILAPMLISIDPERLPKVRGSTLPIKSQRNEMKTFARLCHAAFKKFLYYDEKPSMMLNLQVEVRDMLANDRGNKVLRRLRNNKILTNKFRAEINDIAVQLQCVQVELQSTGGSSDDWWGA